MKLLSFVLSFVVVITVSCNGDSDTERKRKDNFKKPEMPGKVVFDDRRENLKLSNKDTIVKSASYFFSNSNIEDAFILKVDPGIVKSSKAELQIQTSNGDVIYSQKFDAFFLVRGIYEPDKVPKTGGQSAYDNYMTSYWKSLTQAQFEKYFQKSIDSFFTNIYPIESNKIENFAAWEDDISDKEFWKEISKDTTIRLLDITCFDCDEGGTIIGYSRKRKKVITLLEHD